MLSGEFIICGLLSTADVIMEDSPVRDVILTTKKVQPGQTRT